MRTPKNSRQKFGSGPKFSKSHSKAQEAPEVSPWLELKNPHSVRAVIKHRPEAIKELVFVNEPQGLWIRLAEMAEQAKVPVKFREQKELAEQKQARPPKGPKQERIGHAFALVSPKEPVSLDNLFQLDQGEAAAGKPQIWLGLDSLQDPHNVGAIFRTASFFGVKGIVLTKNASAPINATVYDVSAGGVEAIPFAVESNLNRALKLAQRCGLWNLGTTEHAERGIGQVDPKRPWLILVGNEQKGLKRLLLENCDDVCSVPPLGEVSSLNVSVATGVMLATLTAGFGVK